MRVVDLYYRLLAATLVALVLADLHNDMWGFQAGRIFPYRHVPIVPLYGPIGLVLEWIGFVTSALGLLLGVRRRAALVLGAVTMFASLTQHYSNHGTLTFMVLLFTALSPPLVDRRPHATEHAARALAARHRLRLHRPEQGDRRLPGRAEHGEPLPRPSRSVAAARVVRRHVSRAGRGRAVVGHRALRTLRARRALALAEGRVALVLAFHGGITALMPGILPFGLIMLTMSVVYLVSLPPAPQVSTQ
jgi:hypothetical protein